jgi:RNA-directed DNA polymerase
MTGKSLKQSVLHLTKSGPQLAADFYQLKTFDQVAALLAITPYQLFHYTHAGQYYKHLEIPKKHGGVRTIRAPASGLKIVLRKLNQVLQSVYAPKSVAHGFIHGRDVVSNAAEHSPARYILNIDLENFFETITFARVRGMFMGKPYLRNSNVATTLARLCCFNGNLPQGAPSSPVISNMIAARLDSQLKVLARTHKCRYTRYALLS